MTSSTQILVVEDSPTQAAFIRAILESVGYHVDVASDGVKAWERIQAVQPDAVLTDLQMPEMDGLELVEAVSGQFPGVPIVLMTAMGSEEIAAQALNRGAASYVPKLNIETDIIPTMERVLALKKRSLRHAEADRWATELQRKFVLENLDTVVPKVINRLQDDLASFKLWNEGVRLQVGMALDEALVNAIHHGNLEASSTLRVGNSGADYSDLIEKRRDEKPYRDRRVTVVSSVSLEGARFVIRDEGPGFDPSDVPDPLAPENLEKVSGRGLLLINTFMDEVSHNDQGNEITMIKHDNKESQE